MGVKIENDRPVWYGDPVKVKTTTVTGSEEVEINGKIVHRLTGEVTESTITAEEANAIKWNVIEIKPHWEQIEGVKNLLFRSISADSRIGWDVQAMDEEMRRLADRFFDGEINEDQLAAGFERLAQGFINLCEEKQYPTRSMTGFEEAELSVAYDHFRRAILKSAVEHNNAEGKALTHKYNQGWRYYNADYYYKSESAIAAISDKAKDMAADKGFDQFEIPDYKALGRNSCYNFNSVLSGESDYNPKYVVRSVEDKWIKDFDMVPPEGFKWFYEAEGHDEAVRMFEGDEVPRDKSTVWAMYKDMLISNSFDFSLANDSPSDVKNLADLLQFRPASKKEFDAVNKFLKNFQIAPKGYFTEKALRESRERAEQNGWNLQA